MKVEARHIEHFRFEMITDNQKFLSDQTPEYGGEGTGPMPSELFLCSLASCLGQSIAHIAEKKRMKLDSLSLEVEGTKDKEGFQYKEIKVNIKSNNEKEDMQKLLKLARKYCFVSNTLKNGVDVEYCLENKK